MACASESLIMDSSCRVVAVMRRSEARTSSPSLRMATYEFTSSVAAGSVMRGWHFARA